MWPRSHGGITSGLENRHTRVETDMGRRLPPAPTRFSLPPSQGEIMRFNKWLVALAGMLAFMVGAAGLHS
jgi:predicted metallo-beta-lactamase superfamily hydrolase